MDEDLVFVTLNCHDCECPPHECSIYPKFMNPRGKQGCTRRITEDDKDKFTHYTEEVLPFIRMYKNSTTAIKTYNEMCDFFQYIYSRPLGTIINAQGKAIQASQ